MGELPKPEITQENAFMALNAIACQIGPDDTLSQCWLQLISDYIGTRSPGWQDIGSVPSDGNFMVYTSQNQICFAEFEDGRYTLSGGRRDPKFLNELTHWMPLPPPPSEKDIEDTHGSYTQ